jgi:L-threonylcarbamoyladenylate synthase
VNTDVDAAEAALRAGGAVVLPTDTVYGLAALPGNEDVLYALKDRPDAVPIAVLVADVDQATTIGRFDERARRLAASFWPGPLTIVVEALDGGPTVGIRCPDHELLRQLCARVGPLPTTSCNRHGAPTPATAVEAAASLAGDAALVIDGGPCGGVASTVVDMTGDVPVVLREGAVPSSAVDAALH